MVAAASTIHEGAPLPASVSYRLFLVFFGMFQITLGAGLIVGWAGIAGSMLVATPANGGAGLSLDDTTELFGLAAAVNYISPLFLGILLDHCGPRTCSVVSNALVAIGCVVFGSAKQFRTFAVGIALVAFGGPGVQTSLIHTGSLFPKRRFFVMGCVAETITLSFAVFPLMDVLWEETTMGFRELFISLGAMVAFSSLCSFMLWPDKTYQVIEVTEKHHDTALDKAEDAIEETLLAPKDDDVKVASKSLHNASFREQLFSGVYIRLCLFFLVTSYWANFYIAIVTVELGDQQRFDLPDQHTLARQLSFIDAGAIVCAPLSGYLLDSVGFIPTAFITIALGIAQMAFLLIAGTNQILMIASFVSYAVFRAFLFPYFFASLSKKIGFRYFGILSGLSFCISGLSQLSIASLAARMEGTCHEFDSIDYTDCTEGQWNWIHAVQIATLCLLLLVPCLEHRAEVQKRRAQQEALVATTHSSYGSIDADL